MSTTEERPPMWIGHISMSVMDVMASKTFFLALGMRDVGPFDDFAILELRAGTHLIINRADEPVEPGTAAPFDLMVDDIEATHKALAGAGLNPGKIDSNRIHTYFHISEPGGHEILFNSSHNTGLPV